MATVSTNLDKFANAPVGSRDPVYNISSAVALLRFATSDDTMTYLLKKVINIDQNSRNQSCQTAMESVWSVFKLSTKSVDSRRELVANSVHTADADATQLDS